MQTGPRKSKQPVASNGQFDDVLDNVRALGVTATRDQVTSAVRESFPNGTDDTPASEVVRAVFVSMKRQESSR